jgi:hypothetical protein
MRTIVLVVHSKMPKKKPKFKYLRQQGPEWPLNINRKNAPKGSAVNGTPLEALKMRTIVLVVHSKMQKKKPKFKYLRQQGLEWPLNINRKNAPKGSAVNGTPLEALIMGNYRTRRYLKNAKKNQNSDSFRQQGLEWPLNRSQKNAPKGGAVNGTPLEALIMRNFQARSYLKNAKKKPKFGYLRQQVPEWPLNRSQKNALKGVLLTAPPWRLS